MCEQCDNNAWANVTSPGELRIADCGQAWENVNGAMRAISRIRYNRLWEQAEAARKAADEKAALDCLGPTYAAKLAQSDDISRIVVGDIPNYKSFRLETRKDVDTFDSRWVGPWDQDWPAGHPYSVTQLWEWDEYSLEWYSPWHEMLGHKVLINVTIDARVFSTLKLANLPYQ